MILNMFRKFLAKSCRSKRDFLAIHEDKEDSSKFKTKLWVLLQHQVKSGQLIDGQLPLHQKCPRLAHRNRMFINFFPWLIAARLLVE